MKTVRTLGIALLTAGFLVSTPPAAQADTSPRADPAGDVVAQGETDSTVMPWRAHGDIVASRTTHNTGNIRLRLDFRALSRTGAGTMHVFHLRSNVRGRDIVVEAGPGHWAGRVSVTNLAGKRVSCALTRTIDYPGDSVLLVVPRSCLGNPRWVRSGLGTITFAESAVYVDDSRLNGAVHADLTLGPRVYR